MPLKKGIRKIAKVLKGPRHTQQTACTPCAKQQIYDLGGLRVTFLPQLVNIVHQFPPTPRCERQLEGIAMAKRQGVYKGGTARLDRERVKRLSKDGRGPAAIARELGMARSSVYRLLEEAGVRSAGTPLLMSSA
jgi:transposase-like protein